MQYGRNFVKGVLLNNQEFSIPPIGWYPELVLISVVFSNSTNLVVVILNSSVFEIFFVQQTFKKPFRDFSPPAKQKDRVI